MANHEYELTLKWENENSFEMTSKKDGDGLFTVVKIDENASVNIIWPHVDGICRAYFNKILVEIGKEMKE